MSKKTLIAILVIAAILVLYSLSTATATVNPRGKYHSIKGGEAGGVLQWTTIPTLISDLNLAWARIPVKWKDVVSVDGNYNQTLLTGRNDYKYFVNAVKAAQEMGAEVIVTVKGVPDDYKELASAGTDPNGDPVYWPDYCGRISTNRIGKLGEFIKSMLDNLNTQSIQIHYIELWNEPDVVANESESPSAYGCWVKIPSATWPLAQALSDAGVYYAQVLNTVAPYVKRYYPNVKFIAGAAREPQSGFLDQVIEDAWNNIDVLSYHRYVTSYDLNCEIPS